MSRRYWGGSCMPCMYMQQPGGWAEQIIGMGYGQRSNRSNNLFAPCASNNTDPTINLDTLSSLFTRLILQNHLTRLAGDVLGRGSGGGALWGCSLPSTSSAASSSCSICQPHSHHHHHNSQGCGSSNISMCGHNSSSSSSSSNHNNNNNNNNNNSSSSNSNSNNNINVACMCHTCPAATRPYMGANNVFVIPAGHVQQQQPAAASLNPNNNLNMLLNGLGLALGAGCGGGSPVNLSPVGFALPVVGAGIGAPVSQNGSYFSCSQCNFQTL